MKKLNFLLVALVITISGCVSKVPENAFQPSETLLQDRQIQSRFFNTEDEVELLSAGISVLQDMGYTIDETEKDIGVITASKKSDVRDPLMMGLAILAVLANGQKVAIDSVQLVKVSFVTLPSKQQESGFLSRVTFQRVVWNTDGVVTKSEAIKDEALYVEFFSKLSKSVFLEANKI